MKVIDWNKVEWSKIFGAISNMKELKGPQYNSPKERREESTSQMSYLTFTGTNKNNK